MKSIIVWDEGALKQFEEAISFIEADSPQSGEKFRVAIVEKLSELLFQPERYQLDKYKTKNDGSFRALELLKYRIAYQCKSNQIRIIRVRHTKMSPLNY